MYTHARNSMCYGVSLWRWNKIKQWRRFPLNPLYRLAYLFPFFLRSILPPRILVSISRLCYTDLGCTLSGVEDWLVASSAAEFANRLCLEPDRVYQGKGDCFGLLKVQQLVPGCGGRRRTEFYLLLSRQIIWNLVVGCKGKGITCVAAWSRFLLQFMDRSFFG